METYNQDIKKESRSTLIKKAIESLTHKRHDSFLVSKERFEKIIEHFKSLFFHYITEFDHRNAFSWLLHGKKISWLEFYESHCSKKKPSDLKVLYLSGPEPLNDIEIFLDNGISIHNIWAVEAEKNAYNSALEKLKSANLPIKLHKGTLKDFFEYSNHEFDIVYLDACTPIFSQVHNPLDTLKQIFINRRLTGLSVLITNFAEPKEQEKWGEIMSSWFATKDEESVPQEDFSFEQLSRLDPPKYSNYISKNTHAYYDLFLTQFISTFASEMMPMWQAFSFNSVQNNFLLNEQKLIPILDKIRNHDFDGTSYETLIKSTPHYLLSIDGYPLLNWARLALESKASAPLERFLKDKRGRMSLEDALYIGSLLKCFEESDSGFRTFILDVCSPDFQNILKKLDFFDRSLRLTCDVPMKNLIIELFIGLYGFPYIANVNESFSLKYKAKETWMFSNVFVFDQCRYLFDFAPSLDLFETFFERIENQFVVRACIDTIHRNHFVLNNKLFRWGFIEGIYGEFGYGKMSERTNINSNK